MPEYLMRKKDTELVSKSTGDNFEEAVSNLVSAIGGTIDEYERVSFSESQLYHIRQGVDTIRIVISVLALLVVIELVLGGCQVLFQS